MSARKALTAYHLCIRRDGRRCFICKQYITRDPKRGRSVLHHRDNDASHNPADGSNWAAVCWRCNYELNPRGSKPSQEESDSSIIEDTTRQMSEEIVRNKHAEPTFRRWLYAYLIKHFKIEFEISINTGAEISHCSPLTIKRYLAKCCSDAGFAYIAYDTETESTFVYLRTATMQPITNEAINDHSEL